MIIGMISDIHGRFDALELAYAEVSRKCDQVICLGDIVNGGGDADACMAFIRENQIPTVRGNHDDGWLAMCTFSDFKTENFAFMHSLPTWLNYHGLIMVHDDPALATNNPDTILGSQGYILRQEQAEASFESAEIFSESPQIVCIGHTHVPAVFTTKGALAVSPGETVLLPESASCIINPGAVGGQPRSRLGNTYGILDTVTRRFTILPLKIRQLDNPWEGFFRRIVS